MTPRILRIMNNLRKERLEHFTGEGWKWGRKMKKKNVKLSKIMNYIKSVVQKHLFMPFSKHKEKCCLLRLDDTSQNPDKEIFLY